MNKTSVMSRIAGFLTKMASSRKLAFALAIAAVVSGIATVGTMTGASWAKYDIQTVVSLLYVDGIILLILGGVVAFRLLGMLKERRRGQAGAGLQARFVMLFSIVAITPAILVAIFSALFLNYGVQVWFSERVGTALERSAQVARSYLDEHRKNIETSAFAIANELNDSAPYLISNKTVFDQTLTRLAKQRDLYQALVLDSRGNLLSRSKKDISLGIENIPAVAFQTANSGKIAVLGNKTDDRVRALIKLNRFVDAFLLIERNIDFRVIDHISKVNKAVSEYKELEQKRGSFQISFVIIFIIVALLLLLSAIWIGLTLSTQLATPISNLINAAQKISEGDLQARVPINKDKDEISSLSEAFNTMTSQLEQQQQGLIEANRKLDERRRFTETVLAGVSAGVIGLDEQGRITLPNRPAGELLGTRLDEKTGQKLVDVVPEMADLLNETLSRPDRPAQGEIRLRRGDYMRTLLIRIASEKLDNQIIGYVVTFDDVTDLLSAQRKAAWADVARRIAHEIKNPLTPIQLSAERLQRKYLGEISTSPETFKTCTDTIIRQVEEIGRMVNEFSSFARMPQAVIEQINLTEICGQAVFLEQNRNTDIHFTFSAPDETVYLAADERQLSRAMGNLLKNAAESVTSALLSETPPDKGQITLTIEIDEALPDNRGEIRVIIEDNGIGLPVEDRDRLTEPYMTTRTKGTGLGLAIVKKIMEDHNGKLVLKDGRERGAIITLVFPEIEADTMNNTAAVSEPEPATSGKSTHTDGP